MSLVGIMLFRKKANIINNIYNYDLDSESKVKLGSATIFKAVRKHVIYFKSLGDRCTSKPKWYKERIVIREFPLTSIP